MPYGIPKTEAERVATHRALYGTEPPAERYGYGGKKVFTLILDGVSVRHIAPSFEEAEKKAIELAKKFGMHTYEIYEHKMTRVI